MSGRSQAISHNIYTLKRVYRAPTEAIDAVTKHSGGLLHSVSASHIPKNRQQAYYLKRSQNIAGPGHSRDMLFVTMEQCKLAEQVIRVKKLVGLPPPALELLGRLS